MRYLLSRLAQAAPLVLLLLVVNFVLIHSAPGDPIAYLAGQSGDAAYFAEMRARYGLDRPLLEQLGLYLVNVARGPVVDTEALVRHAASGRIRAALDVTDPEPLPSGHPLWSTPGVLVSPHVGGASSAFLPRATRLLQEQLGAYAGGRPLRNLVRS